MFSEYLDMQGEKKNILLYNGFHMQYNDLLVVLEVHISSLSL